MSTVEDLINQYNQSGQRTDQLLNMQASLPDILTQAVASKLGKDNPIVQQRDQAVQDLLNERTRSEAQFAQPQTVTIGGDQAVAPGQNPVGEQATVPNVYYSPQQQRALIQARESARLVPVMNLNDMLSVRYGGLQNFISSVKDLINVGITREERRTQAIKDLMELKKGIVVDTGTRTELRNQYTGELISDIGPSKKSVLSEKDTEKLSTTFDALQKVNSIIDTIQTKGLPSGVPGILARELINKGIAAHIGGVPGLSPEQQLAIGNMIGLRGISERSLIGGRLSGYLLDRLGPAFPGPEKGSDVNLEHLNQLKKTFEQDLTAYAKNKGYSNAGELANSLGLPYSEVSSEITPGTKSGRIPVRRKADGKTGWIKPEKFDPNKYERL